MHLKMQKDKSGENEAKEENSETGFFWIQYECKDSELLNCTSLIS